MDKVYFSNQIAKKLTNHAKNSLIRSEIIAKSLDYKEIQPIHLLYAIYLEKGCLGSNILEDLGIKESFFLNYFKIRSLEKKIIQQEKLPISQDLKKSIIKAFSLAKSLHYSYVGTEHIIFSLFESKDKEIKKVILPKEETKIGENLKSFLDPNQLASISRFFNFPEIASKPKNLKKNYTPYVERFCIDLNKEVRTKKEIFLGRKREVERMINILGRKNKNNPLLIGDPGVGKTALVSKLAQMINVGDVPPSLYKKRIMNLDLAQLIAGTSFRGEFEGRLKEIIKEVSQNGNIILFIDEIHNIVGAGNVAGSLDLANIIKPALARGEMQLIVATTLSEYKKHIEKDAALERRFQTIQIEEPSIEEAKEILFGIRKSYENFHNVSISDEAITLAVDLSKQYIQNRFLPDKAIDVIDEAASNVRSKNKISDCLKEIRKLEEDKEKILEEKEKMVSEENFEMAIKNRKDEKEIEEKLKTLRKKQLEIETENRISIESRDIIETIAKISNVPFEKLSQEKNKKVKNIAKTLNSQIVGQKDAVDRIAKTILRSQSGIGNPDRPLGSFLFLGPTGVGKTFTAKLLASEFFGGEKSLVRIDMSELMERHSLSALIGAPAGYIGYGEGGNLTEKVRRSPYSVVLFDEIEKAHPDIFNILLQILEDGILTDAEGTRVSFKNTIIILTSNIGTEEFTNAVQLGFEYGTQTKKIEQKFSEIKDKAIKELERRIRPELINRLDNIIVFNSLGKNEMRKIASLELSKLERRLKKQEILIEIGKGVIEFIAQKSLAFNQGARLVRKNIQEMIEEKIAEMIVYEKIRKSKVEISLAKEKIILS